MKHPKRFCVPCGKEQQLTIRRGTTYNMYHCQECGDEVGRVGDGDTQHKQLTVRGGMDVKSLSEEAAHDGNLTDIALGNPDVLSDEHVMWCPRDVAAEEARQDTLRTFKVALSGLTARQAEVLAAVNKFGSHEGAAEHLGRKRITITTIMKQIEKKLDKSVNIIHKQGLIGKEVL